MTETPSASSDFLSATKALITLTMSAQRFKRILMVLLAGVTQYLLCNSEYIPLLN
jgi:hypothetical protein